MSIGTTGVVMVDGYPFKPFINPLKIGNSVGISRFNTTSATMKANVVNQESVLLTWQVQRGIFWIFYHPKEMDNFVYMSLKSATPTEIADASQVRLVKYDPIGNAILEDIYSSTYGAIRQSDQSDLRKKQTPQTNKRVNEDFIVALLVDADLVISGADSSVNIQYTAFTPAK